MFRSIEQENFNRILARHIEEPDFPLALQGGTGIGKTRAYLKAIKDSGKRTAIIVPTRQLMMQLVNSDDAKVVGIDLFPFKNRQLIPDAKEWREHKDACFEATVIICTSIGLLIDQRLRGMLNGATEREVILFDEADSLEDAGSLNSDIEITPEELAAYGLQEAEIEEIFAKLIEEGDKDLKGRARGLKRARDEDPTWFRAYGHNDEGGVQVHHITPARIFKKIANRKSTIFTSATLQIQASFQNFQKQLGIERLSALSDVIEPEYHGKLNIFFRKDEELIAILLTCPKPAMIIPTSFEEAQRIGRLCPQAIVRGRGESITDALERMPDDGIFVATAAWVGLDTPIRWKSILIPKSPFGRPVVLDGKHVSKYLSSRNKAAVRMTQGIGRGLRDQDAECDLYLFDERVHWLTPIVPIRFHNEWTKALRATPQRPSTSPSESHPLVRRKAIGHYGKICQSCRKATDVEVYWIGKGRDKGASHSMANIGESVTLLCNECANKSMT